MSSVEYCLAEVRKMILTNRLLPGEKVHQADLAKQLKVSRIPLREALSTLHAEGILDHRPNAGYQVSRFSSDELAEIYVMRRLLETELLQSAELGPRLGEQLEEVNERIREADPTDEAETYLRLNQEFHFLLLNSSPHRLIREEVARLWYRSSFYRAIYLHEAETAAQSIAEHEQIIEAVREKDAEKLVRLSDDHRRLTEELVTLRLGRFHPRGSKIPPLGA